MPMSLTNRTLWRELARMMGPLLLVFGAAAVLLRAADLLPAHLQGLPRGVRSYRSVEQVERAFGHRVAIPSYFPDTLRWPPSRIRVAYARPASVALDIVDRAMGEPFLVVCQTLDPQGSIAPQLIPDAFVLHTTETSIGRSQAWLRRVRSEDGELWTTVRWHSRGRELMLSYRGSVGEVLRMARSLERAPS